jgi:hypothetical protein
VYLEELANALDARLWEGTQVVSTGTRELSGDLARLLGRRAAEPVSGWEVRRAGVRGNFASAMVGAAPASIVNTSRGAALFTAPTALLVDSFSLPQVSGSGLFSFFADASALFAEGAPPLTIAAQIARSQVVIVEVAERFLVSGASVMVADRTLAAIDAAV